MAMLLIVCTSKWTPERWEQQTATSVKLALLIRNSAFDKCKASSLNLAGIHLTASVAISGLIVQLQLFARGELYSDMD